uniref:Uncharacterized protein n=1 Tax=Rhizophora mucronata TaxID=61149 RepID=A0A2P2IS88_RHIMU
MLEGSNGPLIRSMDFITALAGRTLLDGFGEVLSLKHEENPLNTRTSTSSPSTTACTRSASPLAD